MTLEDWLATNTVGRLYSAFSALPDRKAHLLAVAFLRRVWDQLPSHHTRTAVEATEKFVDGRVSPDELARVRSTDLLESGEDLWTLAVPGSYDEELIGRGCAWCECCDRHAAEYECRVARDGYILDGVKAGIQQPDWPAAQAAFHARELVAWAADPEERDTRERAEAIAQFRLHHEIVGPGMDPRGPGWRTETVRLVARGIYRDRTFDQLPILADALQDAGCEDKAVLSHCREVNGEHVRGCWVLDLAMGVS